MIARCARMCWAINAHRIAHAPHCCRWQQFHRLAESISPGGSRISLCPTGRISCSEPRRRARRYRVAGRWSCVSSGTPGNPPKIIRTPCKRGGIMHCFNLLRRFMPPLRGSCHLICFRGLRSPCCRFVSLHPRLLYVAHGRGLMDSSVVND